MSPGSGLGKRSARDASAEGAAVAALLSVALAMFQLSLVPALFSAPDAGAAAPLLPVAFVAAWATVREPVETLPSLVAMAAILGAVSSERVGWFLLALLPTATAASMTQALPVTVPWHRTRAATGPQRPTAPSLTDAAVRSGLTAALGSVAYLALLTLAAGRAELLAARFATIAGAAVWSAALATLLSPVLHALRPRPRGLFG